MMISELDNFRSGYKQGNYDWHREFYARLALAFPEQNYYSATLVNDFLDWCEPRTVIELGGWDGALAQEVLREGMKWTNYEIADVPQVCDDSGYEYVLPDSWIWESPLEGDAFIASHVLEHLSLEHLSALIAALRCESAYVDVPLFPDGNTWQGSTTTHVLPISIGQFDEFWASAGWTIAQDFERNGDIPSYVRYLRR